MPTSVEFVDIAGLVKGASKGEGLGNQFLANIRECDALAQVRSLALLVVYIALRLLLHPPNPELRHQLGPDKVTCLKLCRWSDALRTRM